MRRTSCKFAIVALTLLLLLQGLVLPVLAQDENEVVVAVEEETDNNNNNRELLLLGQDAATTTTGRTTKELEQEETSTTTRLKPNLLYIMTDQHIYHALGFIQAQRADFQNKLHIQTPHIDKLAQYGVYFESTYCVTPSCGPARAAIRTGTSLQRTGILNNACFYDDTFQRMNLIQRRVQKMVSFEQILVEEQGYVAETYGKWHTPFHLYYKRGMYHSQKKSKLKPSDRVIAHNVYSNNKPSFLEYMNVNEYYQDAVQYLLKQDNVTTFHYKSGEQENKFSGLPYKPIQLDARYGYPQPIALTKHNPIFEPWQVNFVSICGVETIPTSKYSSTAVTGTYAVQALKRLSKQQQPFSLSVHFNAPHPPIVASHEYFSYYFNRRKNLYVSPSIHDPMSNSAYKFANQRKLQPLLQNKYPYDDVDKIAELTAAYYAMIEEVDTWIGKLVQVLEREQIFHQTMIVVTADHGEMMGAHGMLNKNILLEEATRVPLIIKFPQSSSSTTTTTTSSSTSFSNNNTNNLNTVTTTTTTLQNITVRDLVSHMDLHATILDYLHVPSELDKSDGKSLRRFVEQRSYNREYDEHFVVVEIDDRIPLNEREFNQELGEIPNFMIRKGEWKLILTKLAKSRVLDMMYNLESDPYEMENLLGNIGSSQESDLVVGKAEHLKALLLEWMERMDGPEKYYSDRKYNLNVGKGDYIEIRDRRTWRAVPYWESDPILSFGPMVFVSDSQTKNGEDKELVGKYVRREYLYVGRTLIPPDKEPLQIRNIRVGGTHASYVSVNPTEGTIPAKGRVRIQVTMVSTKPLQQVLGKNKSLDAWVQFETNVQGKATRKIPIVLEG